MPSSAISRAAACAMRLRLSLRTISLGMPSLEQLVAHLFARAIAAQHPPDQRFLLRGHEFLIEVVDDAGLRLGHPQPGFGIDSYGDHATGRSEHLLRHAF